MRVNKTFSTSNNFDDLFMCTFTADYLTTFFTFNPPKLGNKQQNMLPELGKTKTKKPTQPQNRAGESSIRSNNTLMLCILNSSCMQFLPCLLRNSKKMCLCKALSN